MASRRCPGCGLFNPGSAVVCDCGWSFAEGVMTTSLDERTLQDKPGERRSRAVEQMRVGAVLFVVGLVITVATYAAASSPSGGMYIIAYGPMLFGAIRFVQGASRLNLWNL